MHKLVVDQLHGLLEPLAVVFVVLFESEDESAVCLRDDVGREWDIVDELVHIMPQLQLALVLQLLLDVCLHLLDGAVGVNEVERECLGQLLQRRERLVAEYSVAFLCQVLQDVCRADHDLVAGAPLLADLLLAFHDDAALVLALETHVLRDEQHDHVEHGAAEVHGGVRGELGAQRHHRVVQQRDALRLDGRAGEAVDDDAVGVLRLEQLAQEHLDHVAVAEHLAVLLLAHRLRRRQQVADHDGRHADAARAHDCARGRALASAGRAAQEVHVLWEDEAAAVAVEVVAQHVAERLLEEQLRVLELVGWYDVGEVQQKVLERGEVVAGHKRAEVFQGDEVLVADTGLLEATLKALAADHVGRDLLQSLLERAGVDAVADNVHGVPQIGDVLLLLSAAQRRAAAARGLGRRRHGGHNDGRRRVQRRSGGIHVGRGGGRRHIVKNVLVVQRRRRGLMLLLGRQV
eukprot:PhM_4_TR18053/c4_g1_i6/m.40958